MEACHRTCKRALILDAHPCKEMVVKREVAFFGAIFSQQSLHVREAITEEMLEIAMLS